MIAVMQTNHSRWPDYHSYITSNIWRARVAEAKRLADYRCHICYEPEGVSTRLNGHHRTYARLGCERLSDIVVLCRKCHALYHHVLPSLTPEQRHLPLWAPTLEAEADGS